MSAETPAAPAFDLRRYLYRVAGWSLLGWLVLLPTPLGRWLFAAPAARLVATLLTASGSTAGAHGARLVVTGFPIWQVPTVWTAAPVIILGSAAVLCWPSTLVKRVLGVLQVAFHCTLINVVVLAWVSQTPGRTTDTIDIAHGPAVTVCMYDTLCRGLREVYPLAMAAVLGLSLGFWLLRVAPRPLLGRMADG